MLISFNGFRMEIIEFPVPILKGNVEVINSIREKLYEPEFSDLTVVDFSDLAQGCKTYDEFIEKMKDVSEKDRKKENIQSSPGQAPALGMRRQRHLVFLAHPPQHWMLLQEERTGWGVWFFLFCSIHRYIPINTGIQYRKL